MLLTLTHWTTLSLDPLTHRFFFLIISIQFLHINQTRGHINRLCLICRIHRIVNRNGIRLKWRVRKLANILPLVMWRKFDIIDVFDFKGVIYPFGINIWIEREKEGDLTQSYDKTPYTNRKFENQRTTHTNATKNFDYTTIADRLRTVSWSNK